MGHRAIKERYDIKHIVQVVDGKILIGSPYIPDIIVVNSKGKIEKGYGKKDAYNPNPDLMRYMQELRRDEETGELCRLVNERDVYPQLPELAPIYTHENGRVIKDYYFGAAQYPNTTITGALIDNTFTTDRKVAVKNARRESLMYLKLHREGWVDNFSQLWKSTKKIFVCASNLIRSYINP